jgi:hypothetical protein
MKLALLLSGQPRYIEECFPSIKKFVLDKHDVSIYAHIWWDKSYIGKKFKFHALDEYKEDMSKVFCECYAPWIRMLKIGPQIQFDLSKLSLSEGEMAYELAPEDRPLWLREVAFKQQSYWYSSSEAYLDTSYDLNTNFPKYDGFIKARTDLIFTKDLNLEQFSEKVLYIDDFENKSQLCDWFGYSPDFDALGALAYMTPYPSFAKHIFRSTTLLRKNAEKMEIPIKVENFGVNIFRGYEKPKHMDSYSESNPQDFPYWMQK